MMNLIKYIKTQIQWSRIVFGEGLRTEGILKHIEAEIIEVREQPGDVEEWVDIVILALDGAWRAGYTPEEIVEAMCIKQLKNIRRKWHKPADENTPAFHVVEIEQPIEVDDIPGAEAAR